MIYKNNLELLIIITCILYSSGNLNIYLILEDYTVIYKLEHWKYPVAFMKDRLALN